MGLPVTVIGGYLGSGKTTLVNHLLRTAGGLRLAVLVNEFGALPIDADLIEARDEKVIAIAGGCICCSYGSDLMGSLMDLEAFADEIDHVLIEASGVALPDAIARSLGLLAGYVHDGTVVLADVETVRQRAGDTYLSDTIQHQLESADLLVVNKCDLVDAKELAATRCWLADAAPRARHLETTWSRLDKASLLGAGLERPVAGAHAHGADHAALEFKIEHAVDVEVLGQRLAAPELGLVRAKGILRGADGAYVVLQLVGRRWRIEAAAAGTTGPGRLVCIATGGDIDDASLRAALAASRLSWAESAT